MSPCCRKCCPWECTRLDGVFEVYRKERLFEYCFWKAQWLPRFNSQWVAKQLCFIAQDRAECSWEITFKTKYTYLHYTTRNYFIKVFAFLFNYFNLKLYRRRKIQEHLKQWCLFNKGFILINFSFKTIGRKYGMP